MFQNYLKIAFRNILRQKGSSFINIAGLSVGIAAAILIFLYARHELGYDRFHEGADDIYIVYKQRNTALGTKILYDTWIPLLPQLQSDYPAIELGVRMFDDDEWIVADRRKFQENVTYADPAILQVFTFPLRKGDPATALQDRYSLVISQKIAEKYFGAADPLGKTLAIDFDREYTVRGVLEPIPSNSSLQIDFLAPFESVIDPRNERLNNNWGGSFLYTFVRLEKQASAAELEKQLPKLVHKIWGEEGPNGTRQHQLRLLPLPEFYDRQTNARQYAYILLAVAAAILLIAAINFMNLTTASSLDRAREIGMRKVLGANRRQLIGQFLGESLLMSLLALLVGILLAALLLPLFNDLYQQQLHLPKPPDWQPILGILLLGVLIGLLAGSYPALVLSGFRPAASLKGRLRHHPRGIRLRNLLVVGQFALSAMLILGTGIVWQQIQYMKVQDTNFRKENILALPTGVGDFRDREAAARKLQTFKDELRKTAGVVSVSASSSIPGEYMNWNTFAWPEDWQSEEPLRMRVAVVDHHYFDTYQIPFLEGRNFSPEYRTDAEEALIINETAMKAMGWQTAVGKKVRRGDRHFTVVGVVKDFHWQSLQHEIGPVLHFFSPEESRAFNFISVGFATPDLAALLEQLREKWREFDPQRSFEYFFVDEQFAKLYQTEEQLVSATGLFSLLAIIIACMGVFALASFMVVQKTKEIGIRKTLGASEGNIVWLIGGRFLKLVLAGVLLASLPAYYLLDSWLNNYPYRIEPGWEIFVLTALLALLIALVTIGYQTVKAARANPVEALRYE